MTGGVEKLQQKYGLRVRWRAFPLHPDTPDEGLSLKALFQKKGMQVDVAQVMASLRAAAERFGVPLGDRQMTFNSRLAQELGLWAESQGRGHAFHDHAFRVYFVEGRNLARQEVLLDMAAHVGLDRAEARRVLDQGLFKAAVDRDWELSRARGVTAVPTFMMGLDRLVGAQPLPALETMVKKYIQP